MYVQIRQIKLTLDKIDILCLLYYSNFIEKKKNLLAIQSFQQKKLIQITHCRMILVAQCHKVIVSNYARLLRSL